MSMNSPRILSIRPMPAPCRARLNGWRVNGRPACDCGPRLAVASKARCTAGDAQRRPVGSGCLAAKPSRNATREVNDVRVASRNRRLEHLVAVELAPQSLLEVVISGGAPHREHAA